MPDRQVPGDGGSVVEKERIGEGPAIDRDRSGSDNEADRQLPPVCVPARDEFPIGVLVGRLCAGIAKMIFKQDFNTGRSSLQPRFNEVVRDAPSFLDVHPRSAAASACWAEGSPGCRRNSSRKAAAASRRFPN